MTCKKDEPTPEVSEVIGDGADARRIVKVGEWTLAASVGRGEGEEPRIRDLDLAARLRYARPEKIRDLIKSLTVAGKLNDSEVFTAAVKTSTRGGRPATEYWLTEAQALKVVAKSETDIADAILDEMIRAFMLARRALLPSQAALVKPPIDASALQALLREEVRAVLVSEMRTMVREELATANPTVRATKAGRPGSREIRGKLLRYAELMVPGDLDDAAYMRNRSRWRASGEMELRTVLEYAGKGASWDELPIEKFQHARRHLESMLARATQTAITRPAQGRQHDLFPGQPRP